MQCLYNDLIAAAVAHTDASCHCTDQAPVAALAQMNGLLWLKICAQRKCAHVGIQLQQSKACSIQDPNYICSL